MSNPNFWHIAKHKFNYLYLLKNKFINAYKFGICEHLETRLKTYTGIDIGYPKFSKIQNDKWCHISENDIELIEVYYGEDVEEKEKELRKMIKGNRKKIEGYNHRYLEHYDADNIELHNKILIYFSQLKKIQ